jgi:RWD domain
LTTRKHNFNDNPHPEGTNRHDTCITPSTINIIVMSDEHCEEQEMEAEALTAIFDDCMEIRKDSQPFEWAIKLWPEQQADDDADSPTNHVGIQILATIPLDYPEHSLPELKIEIVKGLTDEHAEELLALAMEEAENNRGMPVMYTVCERLREWLMENNEKGMDDKSMYAQMIKREKEKEREAVGSTMTRSDFGMRAR